MATSGFFTYYDLYGGKPEVYHHPTFIHLLLSTTTTTTESLPTFDELITVTTTTETTSPSDTIDSFESIASTTLESTTSSTNIFYQLVQSVPFAYFHWFLLGLAVLFALFLIIIGICYCHSCCQKRRRRRK